MKTQKTDDGAVRAAMAVLAKRGIADLRAAYKRTHKKPAKGLSRDSLIKSLVATTAAEQPAASHPSKEERKAAKAPRASKRKRDERLPAPGGRVTKTYKGREYTLEILDQGFRVGKDEYKSPTAAALAITKYKAISGPVFWGFAKHAKDAPATEKPAKAPRARKAKKS